MHRIKYVYSIYDCVFRGQIPIQSVFNRVVENYKDPTDSEFLWVLRGRHCIQ